MLSHPLIKSETQIYYQKQQIFNGTYSRNTLLKIKDDAYVANLDEYKSGGSDCIVLYLNDNNET